jgi:uncharacterized membrane protein
VVVAAVFYIGAGALHFIRPAPYLRIRPPYLPWHAAMVRIGGAFEIPGGLGLLVPATRRTAAWGGIRLVGNIRKRATATVSSRREWM